MCIREYTELKRTMPKAKAKKEKKKATPKCKECKKVKKNCTCEKEEKIKIGLDFELNLQQSKFCELYALEETFFASGVESYMEAYKKKGKAAVFYNTAKVNASKLLTNANILKYINYLLELRGLNDTFVDKQLELLITQNADFKSKLGAIKEYNVLKKRIDKGLPLDGLESVTFLWKGDKKKKNEKA